MNLELVDKIANAVLYEGYMLYPYRPTAVKNQQRWNFGVLYPQSYSDSQGGAESTSMQTECLPRNEFAALRRLIPQRAPTEKCDLCSAPVGPEHDHLVEPSTRKINCACQACAVLFSGQAGTKYKRVPRSARFLADFQMTDAQWESLMVPISMAFFFFSTPANKVVALYPSPAGPTESLLTLDTWEEIVRGNPVLQEMESDVEALLVNRIGATREYYLAPIDECYKLVGLIRAHWRGLSGGTEVWTEINNFFSVLKKRK